MPKVAFPNPSMVNVMDQMCVVITTTADGNDIGIRDELNVELIRDLHLVVIDTKAFPEQGRQISLGHGGNLLATSDLVDWSQTNPA